MAKKQKRTRKAAAPRRGSSAAVAAAPQTAALGVTMEIYFRSNPPPDVMSIMRIDGEALPSGHAAVTPGTHTARWDVVSPTVRSVTFAVKVTQDATGKKLLNHPQEKTGPDGKGAGVDNFRV
jgi:hypothetical protein